MGASERSSPAPLDGSGGPRREGPSGGIGSKVGRAIRSLSRSGSSGPGSSRTQLPPPRSSTPISMSNGPNGIGERSRGNTPLPPGRSTTPVQRLYANAALTDPTLLTAGPMPPAMLGLREASPAPLRHASPARLPHQPFCNECGVDLTTGLRYKCSDCPFYLCMNCLQGGSASHNHIHCTTGMMGVGPVGLGQAPLSTSSTSQWTAPLLTSGRQSPSLGLGASSAYPTSLLSNTLDFPTSTSGLNHIQATSAAGMVTTTSAAASSALHLSSTPFRSASPSIRGVLPTRYAPSPTPPPIYVADPEPIVVVDPMPPIYMHSEPNSYYTAPAPQVIEVPTFIEVERTKYVEVPVEKVVEKIVERIVQVERPPSTGAAMLREKLDIDEVESKESQPAAAPPAAADAPQQLFLSEQISTTAGRYSDSSSSSSEEVTRRRFTTTESRLTSLALEESEQRRAQLLAGRTTYQSTKEWSQASSTQEPDPRGQCELKVKLVAGQGFYPQGWTQECNPYVTLTLGGQAHESTIAWDTQRPAWNEDFMFIVDTMESETGYVTEQNLTMQVFNKKLGTMKGDFLGQKQVELGALARGQQRELSVALSTGGTIVIIVGATNFGLTSRGSSRRNSTTATGSGKVLVITNSNSDAEAPPLPIDHPATPSTSTSTPTLPSKPPPSGNFAAPRPATATGTTVTSTSTNLSTAYGSTSGPGTGMGSALRTSAYSTKTLARSGGGIDEPPMPQWSAATGPFPSTVGRTSPPLGVGLTLRRPHSPGRAAILGGSFGPGQPGHPAYPPSALSTASTTPSTNGMSTTTASSDIPSSLRSSSPPRHRSTSPRTRTTSPNSPRSPLRSSPSPRAKLGSKGRGGLFSPPDGSWGNPTGVPTYPKPFGDPIDWA